MNLEWATQLFLFKNVRSGPQELRGLAVSDPVAGERSGLLRKGVVCCRSRPFKGHFSERIWIVRIALFGARSEAKRLPMTVSLIHFVVSFETEKTLSEHFPGLQSNWRRQANV